MKWYLEPKIEKTENNPAPPPFQLETREYPSYKYTLLFHKNVVLYEKVILFWPKPLRTLRKF